MFELFKTLLGGGKAASLLLDARNELLASMEQAQELLTNSLPHLLQAGDATEMVARARCVDKLANKAERSVRKLLVEHLAFERSDAPACLVLMSVAKDVERLVDECRNLVDLSLLVQEAMPEYYRAELQQLGERVRDDLDRSRRAFADNDETSALTLVEGEKPFRGELTQVTDRLLDDESLGVRRAVLAWRAFRSLHRVRAHIGNIASTVVFPVHRIDFAKRAYIREARRDLGLAKENDQSENDRG